MTQRSTPTTMTRTPIQLAALVIGAVFLLVGILSFIPGITTDYDMLTFAGHHSGAKLLGIFEVSILHNIVHLLFGIAGLILARTAATAKAFLVGGGLIYLGSGSTDCSSTWTAPPTSFRSTPPTTGCTSPSEPP